MAIATAASNRPYFTEGPRSGRSNNKASTLHRENELKQVNYDGSESSDEDEFQTETGLITGNNSMNTTKPQVMPFEVCRRDGGSVRSTPDFRTSNHLSPPSSSSFSSHRPLSSQPSSPQFQSKFQQNILAAKASRKVAPPPNFMDIPWFHPGMSRHVAESILLSKNVPDGTYLLRNSTNSDTALTMSVSYKTSVKHYRVTWDGKNLCFGLGKFKTIAEFKEHFESEPIISGDSGLLVYLRHPYPRSVKEFIDYEEPVFSEGLEVLGFNNKPGATPGSFTINSKDGYLTKLGYHRKNWKLRWFTLFKNTLSYYPSKDAVSTNSPLRTIKISDISAVENDTSLGKDNCFKLVTSYRTFFMFAQTSQEAEEWIHVLRWKLAHNTQEIAI